MRKSFSFLFLSLFLLPLASAQKTNSYASVDKFALQIPDSLTGSIADISSYFNSGLTKTSDKARAAYIWLVSNISYDIENMFAINFRQEPKEAVNKALKTRKGICIDYAELYCAILNQMDIKSYVVQGYTKQKGFVDYIPHAWCASLIDSSWMLSDPTWGSGYVQNSVFVRKVDNFFFHTNPEILIKTHIPFDPLWQLLYYPVTNQEFYEGKTALNPKKQYFNYVDSIKVHECKSDIEKLESTSRRIEQNGVKNSLVFEQLKYYKIEIENYYSTQLVNNYNLAVSHYNEGINRLNAFIMYRNNQFKPSKTDSEIADMINDAEQSLTLAKQINKELKSTDPSLSNSIIQLSQSIENAYLNLDEQKAFLNKYLKTSKIGRKSLFYKYTWMGIPLN